MPLTSDGDFGWVVIAVICLNLLMHLVFLVREDIQASIRLYKRRKWYFARLIACCLMKKRSLLSKQKEQQTTVHPEIEETPKTPEDQERPKKKLFILPKAESFHLPSIFQKKPKGRYHRRRPLRFAGL